MVVVFMNCGPEVVYAAHAKDDRYGGSGEHVVLEGELIEPPGLRPSTVVRPTCKFYQNNG